MEGEYGSAAPTISFYITEQNLLIVRLKKLSTSSERDTCEVDGSSRSSLKGVGANLMMMMMMVRKKEQNAKEK